MTTRLLGAAAAAALSILLCAPAHGDILVLRDGSVIPKKFELKQGDVPSLQMLKESGKSNATLSASTCKIRTTSVSSALVVEVYTTTAARNKDFNDGETYAASGDFAGAAHKFGLAAQDLEGADKQVALFKLMISRQYAGGKTAPMLAAADALIAASPNGFYMPKAQMLRARIYISQGNAKAARAALSAITGAAGMNARDFFQAGLTLTDWFELRPAGNNAKKLKAAETKYRNLERQARGKGADAVIEALRARVGAGSCLVRLGEFATARKDFEHVTNNNTVTDKTLLGRAYHGLGDSLYGQAKAELAAAKGDAGKIGKGKDLLQRAALHYLRVTEFYGNDWASDDMLDCTTNLARVFANQYALGDGKDCGLGRRAYEYYRKAAMAMNRGEAKTQLVREAKAFHKDLQAACPKKKN